MYVPEKRIIRHGLANVKFTAPEGSHYAEGFGKLAEYQEKKYKETNDLYDLQKEQADQLNSALEGTSGKDYEYLQQSIVEKRDKIKELYKGKTLKETRTPEFHAELYNIFQDLGNKKNSISTFHKEANEANKIAANTPSIKKKEWQEYINAQMQLPPDQRDKDLINKINTDPGLFSSYNYGDMIVSAEKQADIQIERENETGDLILSYDGKYRPSLGAFNDKKEFVYSASDDVVDRALKGDKRFYNQMAGMLPPEQSQALLWAGQDFEFNKAVKDQAKKFLGAISQQQGYGSDLGKPTKTVKWWEHQRPTATDKKFLQEENELKVIQQRLLGNDERAFNDFLSKDFWRNFDYEYDGDGNIVAINGTYKTKNKTGRKEIEVVERIEVDPQDPGSVKQAINRIKAAENKNKKGITVTPLEKEDKGKSYKAPDGKAYSQQDLKKMGYTEAQIQEAIKAGRLK